MWLTESEINSFTLKRIKNMNIIFFFVYLKQKVNWEFWSDEWKKPKDALDEEWIDIFL